MNKSKILVVDDHAFVREGIAKLINEEESLEVCGMCSDNFQALSAIQSKNPDLVIIDITLGDKSGLDLIKDIKIRFPSLRMLVLSMHNENIYAERCLKAGALGYVMKSEDPAILIEAIGEVMSGKLFLSKKMTQNLFAKAIHNKHETSEDIVTTLSDREYQVFTLIGQGLSNRKIADQLNLSIKTIDTYRENIKQKLCIPTSNELMQFAIQWIHS